MKNDVKTCTVCNLDKPLSEFDVLKKNKPTQYTSGFCKECRRKKNRDWYSSNDYYSKTKTKKRIYEADRRGTEEYRKRHVGYKKHNREVLTDSYLASLLADRLELSIKEVYQTPGLIESERNRIKLFRMIKEHERADPNYRVCSHCDEKKEIDEFRIRTERRNPDKPYTYRSGQCKTCESKLKNKYRMNEK